MPMAHATPRPLRVGLFAKPSDPKPQIAAKHSLLRVSGDRLICGDEADGQKRIVGKVPVHQKPPARRLRQLFAPILNRRTTRNVFQLVEKLKRRFESIATKSFLRD